MEIGIGQQNTNGFRAEATETLLQFQESLKGLLRDVGLEPRRPQDLVDHLKLDKSLAGKVYWLAVSSNPFDNASHLPGAPGMRIFYRAAAAKGAPRADIARSESAFRELQRMIDRHAGDRSTLEILASGYSRSVLERTSERQFRQFFQGASFLWGMHASARLMCRMVVPGTDPSRLDLVKMDGYVGIRRLRENARCSLGQWFVLHAAKPEEAQIKRRAFERIEPIDPSIEPGGVPFLTEFCSKPLPETEIVRYPDGTVQHMLTGSTVGAGSVATVMTGSLVRGPVPRYQSSGDAVSRFVAPLDVPVESMFFDLVVHEDLLPWMRPDPRFRSLLRMSDWLAEGETGGEALPLPVSVEDLGPVLSGGGTVQELPEYDRMMEMVLMRAGWDSSRLRLFRTRVKYPPVGTMIELRVPLPPPPAE